MEKWNDAEIIATWIVLALLAILLFVFFVIKLVFVNFRRQTESQLRENQLKLDYQKKMIETSIIVQEKERDRIASDIHDSLIGKLVTLRLKAHIGADSKDLEGALQDCIADARRISHDLTPPMIKYLKLEELLEDVVNSWKEHISILFYKRACEITLNDDYKLQVVRILQEVMVNIHKHAECTQVKILLRISKKYIILVVSDNGKGIDLNKHVKGLGLKNIELRVMYLSGHYKLKSGKKGTTSIFLFDI